MGSFLAVLSITSVGCVSPGRLADLSDCARASVGVGRGVLVDVELGYLPHPSIGWYVETERIGIDTRHLHGRWKEREFGFPFLCFLVPMHEAHPLWSYLKDAQPSEDADEHGYWLPPLTEGARTFHGIEPDWSFHNATDLKVGVTAGIISARLGVNPLEFLDFTLGFAGLDIGRDDPKPEQSTDETVNR